MAADLDIAHIMCKDLNMDYHIQEQRQWQQQQQHQNRNSISTHVGICQSRKTMTGTVIIYVVHEALFREALSDYEQMWTVDFSSSLLL